MERILHSLPNPSQAVLAVAMAYGLSQLTEADVSFKKYLVKVNLFYFIKVEILLGLPLFEAKKTRD